MGSAGYPAANSSFSRGRSISPPFHNPGGHLPLSKRDKRRSALQERLHDLTASFGQNRDALFRQQLHILQCDMTLINNADPYSPGPLPDSPDDIARLIEETVGGGGKFAKDMASLAGSWYAKYVQEINRIKEDRDAELALLMVGCPLFFLSACQWLNRSSTSIAIITTSNDSSAIKLSGSISPAKSTSSFPRPYENDWYRAFPVRKRA